MWHVCMLEWNVSLMTSIVLWLLLCIYISHASAACLLTPSKTWTVYLWSLLVLVGEISLYMYVPLFTKFQKDILSLSIANETLQFLLYINQKKQKWRENVGDNFFSKTKLQSNLLKRPPPMTLHLLCKATFTKNHLC